MGTKFISRYHPSITILIFLNSLFMFIMALIEYYNDNKHFIIRFQDRISWGHISSSQILSEDFISKFENRLDWYYISKCQKLSEDFIIEFKDKVTWMHISRYQKLSLKFIQKYKHLLDKQELYKNNKINSYDLLKAFSKKKISENFIQINKCNVCLEENLKGFKCKNCVLTICKDCWALLKDTKCIHCTQNFI